MLPLYECADPAPVEPLHSVSNSTVVEKSAIKPFHSATDPTVAESAAEPLQSVVDSNAYVDALTETSCS
jgi:hypothetical protein